MNDEPFTQVVVTPAVAPGFCIMYDGKDLTFASLAQVAIADPTTIGTFFWLNPIDFDVFTEHRQKHLN